MATTAFLAAWRSYNRHPEVLAKIDLKSLDGLSTKTIYAATAPVTTPDAVNWEPLILDVAPIRTQGSLGSTDIALAGTSIRLENRKAGFQTSGTILNLLSAYRFVGSTVTIYLWERGLTSFADAAQVFKGTVLSCEAAVDGITLELRQRTDWNKPVTPRYVNKKDYPRTPEASAGLPLGLFYGNIPGLWLRRPWPSPFATGYHALEHLRGGRQVAKAVMVDSGRGGGAAVNPDARVLIAGHACKSIIDVTKGTMMFMERDGRLALLESPSSVINSSTEAGIKLADNFDFAWLGLPPAEVLVNANSAFNPRHALEPNDVTFVYLDWTAGYRDLRMRMPTLPDITYISLTSQIVVGYQSSSGLAGLQVALWDEALTTNQPSAVTLPVKTTPGEFGTSGAFDWDSVNNPIMRVRFDATASPAGWAKIFFIGLIFRFRPREEILQTERFMGRYRTVPRPERGTRKGPFQLPVMEPAVTELQGKFYGNIQGYADDGSGTYTGVASALIERAPDIVRHLLITYGGQTAAQVENDANIFGSFLEARGVLKDLRGQDLLYALSVSDGTDMMTVLAWLAQSAFVQVFLSPLDDKFKLIVWRDSMPVDYSRVFTPDDVVGPLGLHVELTPHSEVITGVKVAYGFNGFSGAYEQETTLAHDRSVAGYEFRNLRDEYLTVVAGVNDRMDFISDGITVVASLTPGDYTQQSFAEHVRAQMEVAPGILEGTTYLVGHGAKVVAGWNDRLEINDGAVKTATIAAGDYATMEALATAAQTALNAVSSLWLVAYVRSGNTGKFTVSKNTASTRTIMAGANSTSLVRTKSGWATLGIVQFNGDIPVAQTPSVFTADHDRFEEHYWLMGLLVRFDILWQGGVNGTDSATGSRHCADLLGFPADSNVELASGYCAFSPKGIREQAMKKAADRYGARRDLSIEGRALYDTRTARDTRNRMADLMSKPRVVVSFATDRAPDLERGRVIAFSSDFDAILPYPGPDSDGLWAGKGFVVTETEQHLGPTAFYTRVVAVSINEAAVVAPEEQILFGDMLLPVG